MFRAQVPLFFTLVFPNVCTSWKLGQDDKPLPAHRVIARRQCHPHYGNTHTHSHTLVGVTAAKQSNPIIKTQAPGGAKALLELLFFFFLSNQLMNRAFLEAAAWTKIHKVEKVTSSRLQFILVLLLK